jgi:hypothetical protein
LCNPKSACIFVAYKRDKDMTKEQELNLQKLWDSYQEILNKFEFSEWNYGEVPTGQKRALTIRFNKYYKFAISLGYNMMTTLPKQMMP